MIDFFWLHANSCGNPPFVSIMTAQGHIHLFPPHSESFGEKRLKSILKRAFPHCSRSKVGPSNATCDKSSTTTKEKTALYTHVYICTRLKASLNVYLFDGANVSVRTTNILHFHPHLRGVLTTIEQSVHELYTHYKCCKLLRARACAQKTILSQSQCNERIVYILSFFSRRTVYSILKYYSMSRF